MLLAESNIPLALAQQLNESLPSIFFSDFYSLPKHGSNDAGLEKMNPLTVRVFCINKSKADTLFLNMCCTTSQVFDTTATIF